MVIIKIYKREEREREREREKWMLKKIKSLFL